MSLTCKKIDRMRPLQDRHRRIRREEPNFPSLKLQKIAVTRLLSIRCNLTTEHTVYLEMPFFIQLQIHIKAKA